MCRGERVRWGVRWNEDDTKEDKHTKQESLKR